jgi:hypothetical protein
MLMTNVSIVGGKTILLPDEAYYLSKVAKCGGYKTGF